jgi:hypothetical protein
MIEDLTAEELAKRLDSASKALSRAANNLRKGAVSAIDHDKISVGLQRYMSSFVEAVDHASDRAEAGTAAAPKK